MRCILSVVLVLMVSAVANADPVVGDSYFIAPGTGVIEGFQLAGGPFELSTINGGSEFIGVDITGQGDVSSSDTLIQNTATNFDLTLRIETTGNFLPTGVIGDSDVELTTLGLFVGGGIDPVAFTQPVFATSAVIEAFDTSDSSIGTIDVLSLSNFQTGVGGGWDGSLGLDFGNLIPVGDVGAIELQVNYNIAAVPEPSTAMLSLAGLIALCGIKRRSR